MLVLENKDLNNMELEKKFDEYLKIFDVEDTNKNGVHIKRQIVSRTNDDEDISVAGTVYDTEEEVYYLVKQYRAGVTDEDRYMVEVVAGTVESGEDPLECFKREVMEEVGVKVDNVTELGSFYASPGFSKEQMYLYHAEGIKIAEGGGLESENEDIQVLKVSKEVLRDMIYRNRIKDLKSQTLLKDLIK